MDIKDFDSWNELKKRIDSGDEPPLFNEREVWWCSIGMNVGREIYGKGKVYTRPVLVLRKLGRFTFLGVPLTSKRKDLAYHAPISFNGKDGCAIVGQSRTIDSRRLVERMGTMGKKQFNRTHEAFLEMIMNKNPR